MDAKGNSQLEVQWIGSAEEALEAWMPLTLDIHYERPYLGRLQDEEVDQKKNEDACFPSSECVCSYHHNSCGD
jgi:hypothetical protein